MAGATGYSGDAVVRALHDAGHRVRALARDAQRLGELRELCEGNRNLVKGTQAAGVADFVFLSVLKGPEMRAACPSPRRESGWNSPPHLVEVGLGVP